MSTDNHCAGKIFARESALAEGFPLRAASPFLVVEGEVIFGVKQVGICPLRTRSGRGAGGPLFIP